MIGGNYMNMITINTDESVNTATRIKYEPYLLVPEKDAILSKRISEFNFDSPDIDPKLLAGRLIETAIVNRGFGLAAPQCGLDYKVFVMGAEGNYTAIFNPIVTSVSEETIHMEEGCLSFPFMILALTRPKLISVRYQTETGETKDQNFDGLSARIVQHEIDHLNGITFDTLAKPMALKSGLKKREKYIKRFVRNLAEQKRLKELQR